MLPQELYHFVCLLGTSLASFMICQKLNMSLSLGYMLSGILLGPLCLGLVHKTVFIETFSQVGLLIFLFAVGLEIPLHRIWSLKRYIFGFGLVQVALTSVLLSLALGFFFPLATALILGISLSFSSTALVVQLLSERFEMTSHLGRTSLSILLFQDITAIFIFVYLGLIKEIHTTLPILILGKSLFGLVLIGALGFGLSRLTERTLALYRCSEFITAYVILLVLSLSLLTEFFHISLELGAFVTGMAMAGTQWRHQIGTEIHPLRILLLSLFFITLGFEIEHWPSWQNLISIILSGVGMTAIKTGIFVGISKVFGLKNSLVLASLMAGGSEFLFMIVPMLRQDLGPEWTNGLLIMGFVSMLTTPFFFFLAKKFSKPHSIGEPITDRPAVIIAGFGKVGQTIAGLLDHNFISFRVVDYDQDALAQAQKLHYSVVQGDVRDLDFLKKIKIYEAKVLLITFGHLAPCIHLVRSLRRKFPHLAICVEVHEYHQAMEFSGMDVQVVFPETIEAGSHMACLAFQALGFSQDHSQKMVLFPKRPQFLGAKDED